MNTMIALRCPCCHGEIELAQDEEFGFCQYCGTKMLINPAQRISGEISISHKHEIENYLARAQDFEKDGELQKAEVYYNRVLDLDYNNQAAKIGYNRVRGIILEPNIVIERTTSKHDDGANLVIRKGDKTLARIPDGELAYLTLQKGTCCLEMYSHKKLTGRICVKICSEHDKAHIVCKSNRRNQRIKIDNENVAWELNKTNDLPIKLPKGQKSHKIRLLLFIIWLFCGCGMFPFYYWYAGRKAGFFRFITLNFFMFGGFIDFFVIVFGQFRDGAGYYI